MGERMRMFIALFLCKKKCISQKKLCEGIISESHFSNMISGKYHFDQQTYFLMLDRMQVSNHFKNMRLTNELFKHFFIDNIYEIADLFSNCQFESAMFKLDCINFDIFYSLINKMSELISSEDSNVIELVFCLKKIYEGASACNEQLIKIGRCTDNIEKKVNWQVEEVIQIMASLNTEVENTVFQDEVSDSDCNQKQLMLLIMEHITKESFQDSLELIDKNNEKLPKDNFLKIIKSFCLLEIREKELAKEELKKVKGIIYNKTLEHIYMYCCINLEENINFLHYEETMLLCCSFFCNNHVLLYQKAAIRSLAHFYFNHRKYKKAAEYLIKSEKLTKYTMCNKKVR
ncbi:hypothetical protein JZO78_03355 [Enterococcus ureilyticus]|uniref:hypothetical protein n=1 Tax=Enterococcus ureilyticus TaxID=1131292 RepID=UPI001A9316F1|nr:hypothetical protein [Enterococcus ureilyticus]MBO0445376.1 hypothetical protein [Enterococcus ureilyticus]